MSSEDYRQIIDFLFSGAEIPEDLEEEFQEWLSRHGDDERVLKILEGHWESFPADKNGFDLPAGLDDLHRRIGRENSFRRRHKVLGYVAVAAAAAVLFTFGFLSAHISGNIGKETVIMASDENIGKYSLPDGTRVWLNKDSYLRFDSRFNRRKRTVTVEGSSEITHPIGC